MHLALELLLALAVVACGGFLAGVLVRRNGAEMPASGRLAAYGHELATNAVGFLLLGTFVAGSGLLADAVCRAIEMIG